MDYSEIFKKCIKGDKRLEEALELIRQNSKGRIWLVGGYVFRNLAHALYGTPKPNGCDFDFVAEELTETNLLPGWRVKQNTYGSPKFYKGTLTIDLWPLKDTKSIIRRKLEPTIENFLTGVSFTVQSIAYDLCQSKIIGEIGIRALETKTIDIHDLEDLETYTNKRGIATEDYIREKFNDWKPLNFENRCMAIPK